MAEPRPTYSATLLAHARSPRNLGPLEGPDRAFEDVNPLCGDRIRIEVRLREGVVEAAGFRGDACAICLASASVLTEMVRGRPVAEALAIEGATLEDALEAEVRSSRRKCLLLPIDVLRGALGGEG